MHPVLLFDYIDPDWNVVHEERVKLQLMTQYFDAIDWHTFLKEWDKVWKLHILDHTFQKMPNFLGLSPLWIIMCHPLMLVIIKEAKSEKLLLIVFYILRIF